MKAHVAAETKDTQGLGERKAVQHTADQAVGVDEAVSGQPGDLGAVEHRAQVVGDGRLAARHGAGQRQLSHQVMRAAEGHQSFGAEVQAIVLHERGDRPVSLPAAV